MIRRSRETKSRKDTSGNDVRERDTVYWSIRDYFCNALIQLFDMRYREIQMLVNAVRNTD